MATVVLPAPEAPTDWPDAPTEAAYHGLAGDVVRAIEPHTEADPVAILAQLLVAFGNLVGRGPHRMVGATGHHLNEFVLLVGRTSKGRKGSSWDCVEDVVGSVDPAWAETRIQSGMTSGEGLIWHVRDAGPISLRPGDVDPGVEDKRLLVLEPEFALVLRVLAREGNTLSAVLRNAWDGKSLQTMAKNAPARATAAHVSVVGHILSGVRRKFEREIRRRHVSNVAGSEPTGYRLYNSTGEKYRNEEGPLDPEWAVAAGQRIHALRTARGLSAERLAAQADVTGSYVSRLERGGVPNPGYVTLTRIADALGFRSSDEMLGSVAEPGPGTSREPSRVALIEGWLPVLERDLERRHSALAWIREHLVARCGRKGYCRVTRRELLDLADRLQASMTETQETIEQWLPRQTTLL